MLLTLAIPRGDVKPAAKALLRRFGSVSNVLDADPEVIVLGTGRAQQFPPRQLVFAMARRGIGLETMETRSAASTFNVLAGEGRRVAAVLYL